MDRETEIWLWVFGIATLVLLLLWLGTRKGKDQL